MGTGRGLTGFGLAAAAMALALCSWGCTRIPGQEGGGPLKWDELGDWAGIAPRPAPDAARLRALVDELTPAAEKRRRREPGRLRDDYVGRFVCERRFNKWRRLLPGNAHGDLLLYVPGHPEARRVYGSENEWGGGFLLGDQILRGQSIDFYDVATRERVAAKRQRFVLGLFGFYVWMTRRSVTPVSRFGVPSVDRLKDPSVAFSDVRYRLKRGQFFLTGLVGWRRVNRRRYIQLLWIPIPVAKAGP